MDVERHINLPRTSHESILFSIEGKPTRIYLIKMGSLGFEDTRSKYVSDWNCWYLNSEDYHTIRKERGNLDNIKAVFERSDQVIITQ